MKIRKRYIWAFILCCYFAAVLMICLAKPEDIPTIQISFFGIPTDKIAHFLMFLPYPAIAYAVFRPAEGNRWRHIAVLAAIFAAGLGLAMGTERLQGLSEYRSYEIEDFYADVLGMELSAFITALHIIFLKNKHKTDR